MPRRYGDDGAAVETILLDAARHHAITADRIEPRHLDDLERRYQLRVSEIEPRVYWRLTDNWLELSVRLLSPDHGTREIKDAMNREILLKLDAAGIAIALATYEITGLPTILMSQEPAR